MKACVVFGVCFVACLVHAMDNCEHKGWGGNACSLEGSLRVVSKPGGLQVSKDKCNPFYQKGDFKDQPSVSFPDADSAQTYALLMVDPDAPNHPEGKYWLHWIVENIPGDDIKKGDLKRGKVIAPYRGPTPPAGTGTHRYMILVYRHRSPGGSGGKPIPDSERRLFDPTVWAADRLCGPLSGVQFRTNSSGKEGKD